MDAAFIVESIARSGGASFVHRTKGKQGKKFFDRGLAGFGVKGSSRLCRGYGQNQGYQGTIKGRHNGPFGSLVQFPISSRRGTHVH